MASIHKQARLSVDADEVWDVVRDVGAVHTRFAPGFVTDTTIEDGARVVTFANGFVAREVIVGVDEAARRLVYSARSERLAHHNASFQVVPEPHGCRLVWIADLLPDVATHTVEPMMDDGMTVIQATLQRLSKSDT